MAAVSAVALALARQAGSILSADIARESRRRMAEPVQPELVGHQHLGWRRGAIGRRRALGNQRRRHARSGRRYRRRRWRVRLERPDRRADLRAGLVIE